jgi:hypothetical protein
MSSLRKKKPKRASSSAGEGGKPEGVRVGERERKRESMGRAVGWGGVRRGIKNCVWAVTLHPRNVESAKFVNEFVGLHWRRVFCFARRQHL